MPHTIYSNFVLENKLEDLLTTHIDMNQFATQDASLTQEPGMIKKVHTYTSTGDVEDLAMGEGNSDEIEVSFTEVAYTVGVTQGNFNYYDEQEMTDPMVVDAGLYGLATRMTNDLTAKIVAEFDKATILADARATGLTFDAVVDAIAKFPKEQTEDQGLFMLINRADLAALRKNLKDELKYVEAFVRTGYVGSVCGVPIYVSDAVPAKKAFIATKAAVTVFTKKGSEIEQERDANTRKNKVFARKVMLVALTDATQVVKVGTGAAKYTEVTAESGNPKTSKWYTRSGSGTTQSPYVYTRSTDTSMQVGTTYYASDIPEFDD